MIFPKQAGFAGIAAFFIFGFLAVTALFIFNLSQKKADEPVSLLPSFSPSPSVAQSTPTPSPSVLILPSPSTAGLIQSPAGIKNTPAPQSTVFIEQIKYEKENNRPKITLTGRNFGDKKHQILLDNNVHNYGYTIISWNNDRIEFYGSEWVPKNKTVSVAILANNGEKSNSVTFNNE